MAAIESVAFRRKGKLNMKNAPTYEAHEIESLVVECSGCHTEIAFDLNSEYRASKIACPGCDKDVLAVHRQQDTFEFNALTFFKMFLGLGDVKRVSFRVRQERK